MTVLSTQTIDNQWDVSNLRATSKAASTTIMSLGFDEDKDQHHSFAAAANSVIVWIEDQNALFESVKIKLPPMFRNLMKSGLIKVKALNLIPIATLLDYSTTAVDVGNETMLSNKC